MSFIEVHLLAMLIVCGGGEQCYIQVLFYELQGVVKCIFSKQHVLIKY